MHSTKDIEAVLQQLNEQDQLIAGKIEKIKLTHEQRRVEMLMELGSNQKTKALTDAFESEQIRLKEKLQELNGLYIEQQNTIQYLQAENASLRIVLAELVKALDSFKGFASIDNQLLFKARKVIKISNALDIAAHFDWLKHIYNDAASIAFEFDKTRRVKTRTLRVLSKTLKDYREFMFDQKAKREVNHEQHKD